MLNVDLIQTVIFDLGRVLIHVDFTGGLFKYYQNKQNVTDDEILEELFKDQIFIDFNTGKINSQDVYQKIIDKYHLPLSYKQFTYEWCNIFAPMDGMHSVVERICNKFRAGLLSDIDPLHWQYCRENFPILKYFDNPALSFEIGALKPDPRCYQRAAQNSNSNIRNCLFIDDREINVAGAREVGMQALHFTGVADLEKELHDLGV